MMGALGPLRSPQFRSVWLAGLVSESGDWMLLVALPLVVYNLTGSAFGTSVALLVELVPGIVLAPIAGRCVDRWDRRRVLIWVSLLQGLGLLPLLAAHSRGDLPIVYAVIVVEASLLSFFDPAKNAWLPSLVATDDLVAANSLGGFGQNVARLIGGPTGGVLLAVGGLRLVVAVDAGSYLIAALLIAVVRGTAPSATTASRESSAAAYRDVLGARPVRSALAVTFIAQVAQGVFAVLFILFVVQRLHGGDSEVGVYRGVQAVGAVAGALALAALARRWAASALVAPSLLIFGLLDLGLWNLSYVTTSAPVYLALFVVVGAPGLILVTGIVSVLQQSTVPDVRGRVFSAFGLVGNAGQLLGIVAAGVLADDVGLMVMLNAQGAMYLLAAIPAISLAGDARARRRGQRRTSLRGQPASPAM